MIRGWRRGEAGLRQPERPVDLLLELLFVRLTGRVLDHQTYGDVVRVGVLVPRTRLENQRLILHVGEELSGPRRILGAVPQRRQEILIFSEVGQPAGVVEELAECDLVPGLWQARQTLADRVV